eukprot:1407614-Amphidinium_carterae.1
MACYQQRFADNHKKYRELLMASSLCQAMCTSTSVFLRLHGALHCIVVDAHLPTEVAPHRKKQSPNTIVNIDKIPCSATISYVLHTSGQILLGNATRFSHFPRSACTIIMINMKMLTDRLKLFL